MANSKASSDNYEYATVDTLPGASGYFTNEVVPRDKFQKGKVHKLFFSIREYPDDVSEAPSTNAVVTVALQFKCPGDLGWTDFVPLDGSTFAVGNRVALEDIGAAVRWRAGVRSDEYTSGSVTFGFDW
jgi:hypothetical protein